MSTRTEPYRKHVAHDEKSRLFKFCPEMVSLETWCFFRRRATPSIKFRRTHLHTWVERGTVRFKSLAQEHNTMTLARAQTRTTRSGMWQPAPHRCYNNCIKYVNFLIGGKRVTCRGSKLTNSLERTKLINSLGKQQLELSTRTWSGRASWNRRKFRSQPA